MEPTLITTLPSELLCQIIQHLLNVHAFGSVAALGQCGRRLHNCALPLLYREVGSVHTFVGQDALIWAAENDEIDTLTALLECGVDPNARFWSTLPNCSRQGVFAAQKLRRRLSPRRDAHLIAALLQTDVAYHRRRPDWEHVSFFRKWYMATVDGKIPNSYPTRASRSEGWDADVAALIEASTFSCRKPSHGPPHFTPPQYSWTALHVAAKRGNQRTVQVLLDHGAEIELRCSGLCDCLVPVTPVQRPPTFTALHLAVCSRNGETTRLLLGRGANPMLAGQVNCGVSSPHARSSDALPALHTAALHGDVVMCQILLDDQTQRGSQDVGTIVGWCDARQRHAIDYAVVAGHTRTTGVWLLAREDDPLHQLTRNDRSFFAPLNLLCRHGKYRDALYLLDSIGNNNNNNKHENAYTLALQLCFVRSQFPPMPFNTVQTSLRNYLAEHTELLVSGEHKPPLEDGEEPLVCLVKRLLDLGADPSIVMPFKGEEEYAWGQPALHLAAGRGEVKALAAMLDFGAPLERRVIRPTLVAHPNNQTPLGAALTPPDESPTIQDRRKYLEIVLSLLERGASLQKALGPWQRPGPRVVLWPLFFTHERTRKPWYNLDSFDLFERILELAAAQHGKEPAEWAIDVLYLSIMCGRPNGNLCKWLVQRFGVVPSDFPSKSLTRMSPANFRERDRKYNEPGMMDWLLDTLPETALNRELNPVQRRWGLAGVYAAHSRYHAAKSLVERGWIDRNPVILDNQEPQFTPSEIVLFRMQFTLHQLCLRPDHEGTVQCTQAILAQMATLSANDRTLAMTCSGAPVTSWLVHRISHLPPRRSRDQPMELLRLLLRERSVPLYGVQGRFHGELPAPRSKSLAAVYPVPVAVQFGEIEVLELIFKETPPAKPEEIQEILAMALDASRGPPNPATLQAILEHSPVDLTALISRTDTPNSNGVSGDIPPLYYLLKSLYNKYIVPWQPPKRKRRHHDCDCVLITQDESLVRCVALLVEHGASWTQASEPSGETALDVLAAILDTEGCLTGEADWVTFFPDLVPVHNLSTLKRHVILDWRGDGAAGRVRSDGFNPVEFSKLGVQARW